MIDKLKYTHLINKFINKFINSYMPLLFFINPLKLVFLCICQFIAETAKSFFAKKITDLYDVYCTLYVRPSCPKYAQL